MSIHVVNKENIHMNLVNNIVFIKVYAELNLGDDLFIKILLERYKNCTFYLEANSYYNQVFKDYNNIIVFKKENKYNLINKVKGFLIRKFFPKNYQKLLQSIILERNNEYFEKSDIFLSIGGSVFMQPRKLPYYYDVEYYNIISKVFKKKPIFYLGGNFGPYSDECYKHSYDKIFREATDVCFREEKSFKLFSHLNNVRFKPDIVFGLNDNNIKKIEKSIGFSIVGPKKHIREFEKEPYVKKYVSLINHFIKNGYVIKIFSFSKNEGDEIIIDDIFEKINKSDKISKVYYNGDLDYFLKEYKSVESVFCGRFHSMILSMVFNQKIYPVIYSKKMTNVLEDIGYNGKVIDIKEFYHKDFTNIEKELIENIYIINNLKSNAMLQFQELDKYLK